MIINFFSGRHYLPDIIMVALRYYLAYKLSYLEIEEIFAESHIHFDHSTLNLDTYSKVAIAKLYTTKTPITAADVLNVTSGMDTL